MKRLAPPFLELGFYFANIPESDAFTQLVTALIGNGAKLTGEASARRGAGFKDMAFASISDSPLPEPLTTDVSTIMRSLTDPDVRIIEVYMHGATGLTLNTAEIVTYLSISREAVRTDKHPMAILTEGELFSGTLRHDFPQRARKAGMQVYHRFFALIEALQPAYAAITVENPLECPTDLRRDPRSLAFCDFFLSRAYIGASKLRTIQTLFTGAFIEPMGDGLYISCTEEFNPEGRSLDAEYAQRRSVDVAKLIASVGD
jgi:hypothetical protein